MYSQPRSLVSTLLESESWRVSIDLTTLGEEIIIMRFSAEADKRRDRLREPLPPLIRANSLWQPRDKIGKSIRHDQLAAGYGRVRRGDGLCVGHIGVACPLGREIIGEADTRNTQAIPVAPRSRSDNACAHRLVTPALTDSPVGMGKPNRQPMRSMITDAGAWLTDWAPVCHVGEGTRAEHHIGLKLFLCIAFDREQEREMIGALSLPAYTRS